MYGWICCIILLVLLIYLICKYKDKIELDRSEQRKLETDVELLKQLKNILKNDIEDLLDQTDIAIERYQNTQRLKVEELELYFEAQKRRRQEIMDADIELRENELNAILLNKKENAEREVREVQEQCNNEITRIITESKLLIDEYRSAVEDERLKFESLRAPLVLYEKERQERLYYTILLPEEYQDDIEFLLTTVAEKVQHPDIISKLVWNEYVKNYLADTFKRIDIKEEPGIYKLTSLVNGKSYVGKSTNVKKRIQDHFKSVVGILSIADLAVHHAIRKEGFWNWTIEIITYCDKEKLNELERYYIEFFKCQEYGWNRTSGG